jgi:hypothetical protein
VLELRRQQHERKGVGETQGSELACSHRSAAQVAVADRPLKTPVVLCPGWSS